MGVEHLLLNGDLVVLLKVSKLQIP